MHKHIFAGVCATMACAAPVSAQPSFDCTKASSDVEELICNDPTLAALDVRLSTVFADALDTAKGLDAGSSAAEQDLRATQRGWIKGRDDCWKASDMRACVSDSYLTREAELVALWMLKEPLAVQSYTCDETPANEITVFYFDTELPAIRAEYGDSIRAGWLVPAGSGAKYALSFGGAFWEKGKEARLEWTEGQASICVAAQ